MQSQRVLQHAGTEPETWCPFQARFHIDHGAVRLDDSLHDSEPEPVALRFRGKERIKYLAPLLLGHTATCVRNH